MNVKLKRAVKQAMAFIPTPLPVGVEQFEKWASDIIFTYNLPDNDSFRWSLATMVQHCGQSEATKPKRYFGRCALKGASNQVAAYIMQTLKNKQIAEQEKAKAAAEAAKVEAETASGTDTQKTQG